MLGECQSKCDHLARAPLRPETAEQLHQIYLAKGILATTAIEGNTLTEEQVRQHVEGKLQVPVSKKYLQREVDNILRACNGITDLVHSGRTPDLDLARVKGLNAQVLKDLELAEDVHAGEIRTHSVGIGNVYRGAPPEDCEYLLDRLCAWLNSDTFKPTDELREYAIAFALLRAVIAHLYLAWIHPFGDGNGRTARLVEFQILISSGVPAPGAHLLSNHYNATRTEYYRQLSLASKSAGNALPFLSYAVQGFLDGLRQQLEFIWDQNYDVVWRNYVHETFRDKAGAANERRRHLILDLSRQAAPVPRQRLSEISTRLAKAYARKTDKTLSRDVNILRDMGLLEEEAKGYRAHKELILAFLPTTARS